ncbi:hypothetical protein [Sphingomonas sp.]|uniref:hypothetical protein n=1 Tax=Sphingomonas sp. TaxID=28214 RepID=UPI002FD897EA
MRRTQPAEALCRYFRDDDQRTGQGHALQHRMRSDMDGIGWIWQVARVMVSQVHRIFGPDGNIEMRLRIVPASEHDGSQQRA